MSKSDSDVVAFDKNSLIRLLVLIGIFLLFGSILFWWKTIYLGADNVFWDMMSNNLATTSVTKHTTQTSNDQTVDQYTQLLFGTTRAVHSLSVLKQGSSEVKSEIIGTPTADYSRYISIKSKDNPTKTSKVVGVWAKSEDPRSIKVQYYQQSLINIFPFANLNYEQRQQLIKFLKDNKVYQFSSSDVKRVTESGQSAYKITVTVDPVGYIKSLQLLNKLTGVTSLNLNSEQYKNSPPFKVDLTIEKISRQIIKVNYPNSNQVEAYSSQGLEPGIVFPTNTISITELQKRVIKNLQK